MSTTTVTPTIQTRPRARRWGWLVLALLIFTAGGLFAQATGGSTTNAFNFNIGMNLPEEPKKIDVAIRIVFLITLLTVAPTLVMLMTSFTRIKIGRAHV